MWEKITQIFRQRKDDRWIYGLLLTGSLIGLLGSFVLSVEALQLARDPEAALSCSVSLVLNCATVANHPSAQVLGFPNSFVGMMTLPVMVTIAVAGLMGTKFPRLFMRGAQLGATAGLLFAAWMFYMSYVVIGVLCPWCLSVDVGMLMIYFAVSRYNIRENNLCVPDMGKKLQPFIARDYDKAALVGIVVLMAVAIILKYGNELFA